MACCVTIPVVAAASTVITMQTFQIAVQKMETLMAKSIASAAVGGALSYFLLKRKDLVEILGFELQQYWTDFILIGASSGIGTIISIYAIPFLQTKLVPNSTMLHWASIAANPLITGGIYAGSKNLLVLPKSEEMMENFLLGAGSDLAGDKFVSSFWVR